jgi:iron(III) transport system substrate-binding protein
MAKTQLTVYTAIEAEDLKRYAATFNEDHPDIEINWVVIQQVLLLQNY